MVNSVWSAAECWPEWVLPFNSGGKSFSLITEPLIAAIPCLVRKGQKLSRLGAALNSLSVHIFFFFSFSLVPVKKEETLSSWKIAPHSLNIWTAFYSVCRIGRVFGQQLSCRPLGHRAITVGWEGGWPSTVGNGTVRSHLRVGFPPRMPTWPLCSFCYS